MAGTKEHTAAPSMASLLNTVAHKKQRRAMESFILVGKHVLETRFQLDLKIAAEREVEKLDNLYLQRGSEHALCVSVPWVWTPSCACVCQERASKLSQRKHKGGTENCAGFLEGTGALQAVQRVLGS